MAACAGCRDAWNDVVAVRADWTCERDAYSIGFVEDRLMLSTSAYPRDIPGVSRERNVNGVSFAVANAPGSSRVRSKRRGSRRRRTRPTITRVFTALDRAAGMQRSPVV